jgi:hypothetical protein
MCQEGVPDTAVEGVYGQMWTPLKAEPRTEFGWSQRIIISKPQ